MESVILTNPVVIIGFIISLALCVFALVKKTHFTVTAVSAVIFVLTVAYALLNGAGLYETGAVATVFFIINMIPYLNKGGDK